MNREEVRVTDSTTGGVKANKLCRLDLIPANPLMDLGEHFGKGCAKYVARNWERGYDWSLSFAAAQRHMWLFWGGENLDPETKSKHVIAAAWHMLALAEFMDTHPEKDDRVKPEGPKVLMNDGTWAPASKSFSDTVAGIDKALSRANVGVSTEKYGPTPEHIKELLENE